MSKRIAKVGDIVLHHGHYHTILGFEDRAVKRQGKPELARVAVFDSNPADAKKGYLVKCNEPDLAYSDELGAFYLPGRVLANDERILYEVLAGVRPPAETHLVARKILADADLVELLADVKQKQRLVGIVARRKRLDQLGIDPDDLVGLEPAEREATVNKAAAKYAKLAVAHCLELRDIQAAGPPEPTAEGAVA